jgi:hypothetical protein
MKKINNYCYILSSIGLKKLHKIFCETIFYTIYGNVYHIHIETVQRALL